MYIFPSQSGAGDDEYEDDEEEEEEEEVEEEEEIEDYGENGDQEGIEDVDVYEVCLSFIGKNKHWEL